MTNNKPLVSIVIPCYNHENYVQESIQSVIAQDYDNIELIIIDDGSSDNSVNKIEEMIQACQQRFKRFEFRYRPNKGLCNTLNEALEWCEGKFFSPIASDDILLPYKTKLQVEEFSKVNVSNIVAIFGAILPFCSGEKVTNKKIKFYKKSYTFNDVFFRKSKLSAPSVMLVTEKIRSVGGYNMNFKIEDFYLWLKLTEDGSKVIYLNTPLVFYRRHDENLSKKEGVMLRGVVDILDEYREHPDYKEALYRTYLVHAGDLAQEQKISSLRYFFCALLKMPSLVFSKLTIVFFYRAIIGFSRKNN